MCGPGTIRRIRCAAGLILWTLAALCAQGPAPRARPGQAPSPAPPALAASPKDDQPIFRVETKLVVLHATVLDKDKHLITDLGRDHF